MNSIRGLLSRTTIADEKITVQSVVRQAQSENRSRGNPVKAETHGESQDPTVPSLTILDEESVNDQTQGFDPYDSMRHSQEPHD